MIQWFRSGRRPQGRAPALVGALAIGIVAAIAIFTNSPGDVIADARYEHSADPAQFLARHGSVWDAERTLGAPTQYFSPALPVYQAALQGLGAAPWVIQRATHALLFTLAGVGAMQFARQFLARTEVALLAGFVYAFNPYTTQALLPSGLFMAYVAAPWLALAVERGVRPGADRWRWAAVFAIAVFCLGSLNIPSMVLALLPAVGILAFAAISRTCRVRWIVGFGWRTAVLTLGTTAAMLSVVRLNGDVLRVNLLTTETPETVAVASSASETWRGLGNWLSYVHLNGSQVRDQASPYFTDELVILCSFVTLVLAGYGIVRGRDRRRGALAVIAAASVVVMVGIYPAEHPSPLARVLESAFDSSLFVRGFRNLYKAGPGLMLPVAVLAAGGTWHLVGGVRSTRPGIRVGGRVLVGGAAIVALAIAAAPFWTGGLYPSEAGYDAIPGYWQEAFSWFDEQPAEPGVLILPSTARTTYRWGVVNDTLFDAHLRQPAVSARTLPQSTRFIADLTEAVDDYTRSSSAEVATLAPILRRMNVRWILLQNDLEWLLGGLPRPSSYDFIRDDPAFEQVAAFGGAGENVVGPVSLDQRSAREAELAPVEVYELVDRPGEGATRTDSVVLVEGAGDSWPALSEAGWLDNGIVYGGDLDSANRSTMLETAAAYIITDGSQRRAQRVFLSQSERSPVLAPADDVGREPINLFDEIESQTVADHGDFAGVSASHFGRAFGVWQRAWQPSHAVDRDDLTAWATELGGAQFLALELAEPTMVDTVEIALYHEVIDDGGVSGAAGMIEEVRVVVHTTDGAERELREAGADRVSVALDRPVEAATIEVYLQRRAGSSGLMGITEVEVSGPGGLLDGRTWLRTPGPADGADGEARARELAETPTFHLFRRVTGSGESPEESTLRRRYWTPGGDTEIEAHIGVDDHTPDAVIDRLIGSEVSAVASSRYQGLPEGSARNLLDGSIATAWQFDHGEPATATITVPGYEIDELQVWLIASGSLPFELSRLGDFSVDVHTSAGRVEHFPVSLGAEPECDPAFAAFGDDICIERVVLPVTPTSVDQVVIEAPAGGEPAALFRRPPVQVSDVVLLRDGSSVIPDDAIAPSLACRPLLDSDAEPVLLRPQATPSLGALAEGVTFRSCAPLRLELGWHSIAASAEIPHAVNRIELGPPAAPLPHERTRGVDIAVASPTERSLSTQVVAGDVIITGVPYHEGWDLDAGGVAGHGLAVDGFVAFAPTSDGIVELTMSFGPQRWYRWAWFVTAATVAVCVWLLVPSRRRR